MVRAKLLSAATHISQRVYRHKISALSTLFTASFLFSLFLYISLGTILADDPRLVPHAIRNARNVLLITAHPDDECLFFTPSILHNSENPDVNRHILVLSSGNYNNLGPNRKLEVKASCTELGIPDDKCVILDNPDLQDNPRQWWDESIIENLLEKYVTSWGIDLIITFDQYGISGHVNHRSVSNGVKKFSNDHQHNPPAYAVQTKFVLRKYSSLIDLIPSSVPFTWRILEAFFLPVSYSYGTNPVVTPGSDEPIPTTKDDDRYSDRALIVTNLHQYMKGRAAFKQHASQYSWDRVLYLILSRYMWFNDLKKL